MNLTKLPKGATWVARGQLMFSEPDSFTEGCDPKRSVTHFLDPEEMTFTASSLEMLRAELRDHFKVADDCLEYPDNDWEPSRLDIQVHQVKPGVVGRLRKKTVDEFQRGVRELWLSTYIFEISVVLKGFRPVQLDDAFREGTPLRNLDV